MKLDDKTIKELIEVLDFNILIFEKASKDRNAGYKDKWLASSKIKQCNRLKEKLKGGLEQ